jgi:hypothetical protein
MTLRETLARALAALGGLLVWSALALQLYLLLGQVWPPLLAAWRFVGYFTILTNLLAAVALSHAALRYERRDGLGAAAFELAVATAIAMVGLVYSLLLRATWNPQGLQKLADAALHDVAPLVCVSYFLLRARRRLRRADVLWALVFPLGYVLYAMARGAADGWYAYWFLDPRHLSAGRMALSVGALSAAFLAMASVLALISNQLNAARQK